ncbi:NAD(P)-dependent oxidoreductase [Paenarthrobacter sp. DKR-5]|uniref:NAD(P)-dependent oxidoreductase n=1 Tax=Paenarthrobacter sp. DKR-5 TaxID=2835535 RepID=UPI001BDD758E|nr:NAD(P)-dependent oxidoreductase [Paenarthrobacter sp. DKR-5]MBT1004294.1 NAD(P)-dependent oxidoreductase [Paenarthrobacter sp. DKR-5]
MALAVTVLGTGIMGRGMASHLLSEGFDVTVWNRTPEKAQPLANEGAHVATDVASAVAGAKVVITILIDADAVLEVARELPGALAEGAVWLQASTIGAEGTAAVARFAEQNNLPLVDSPVLGTKQPAESGQLTALVAGPSELIKAARPVLEAISAKVVETGSRIGDGTALKLACNAWLATITAGIAQSLALAAAQGLDPQLFLDAIKGSAVDTPYAQLKGGAMTAETYPTAFALDGLAKDLGLITDAARAHGVDTGILEAVSGRFGTASAAGHGSEDIAAVYESFKHRP